MRILCLEQGDWVKPTDFPSNGRDWEARRFGDFDILPNSRGRDTDYPVNDANSPMKIANFNGVGGGTVIYTAHWPRMHPSDFRTRSLDGVADDWPIDYWALERFYDENDRMMGSSGLAGDPGVPPRNPPMPPLPLGRTSTVYAKAMNRLGWHWWPSDTTIATQPYEGRAQCINLGHCTPGCAQGAKASVDITYWPLAIRAGVVLRTRCRVREITTNEHGMAAAAIYYDAEGKERFQPAEVVIVACNGVGTPRLLLNSASARYNRLANSAAWSARTDAAPLASHRLRARRIRRRARADHRAVEQKNSTRPIPATSCAATPAVRPRLRPGHQAITNIGTAPPALGPRASRRLPRDAEPPRQHRRRLRGPARGAQPRHARPHLKDRTASPRRVTTRSARTRGAWGTACAEEILTEAGATQCTPALLNYPGHLLGTCRMGDDPERSVVNAWGRSHDVKNLFIVDGSIWVTGGGVNPTSTIQALALYVADQMKQRLATLFD